VKFAQLAQATVIVLAAFGVYGFVATAKDGEARRACTALCAMKPNYSSRNRLAPDFELPSMRDGQKKRLSDYRGKVVILNFWTKTCRPCLEEMPALAQLGKALLRHPEIALVTITTDESAEDAKETLKSVLGGSNPAFEVLIDSEATIVREKYGTKLFPETWFIDKQGVIRARFDGPREWDSALPIDVALSLSTPLPCEVTYSQGRPTGAHASFCDELAPGGT
jgi:thiol-disulfide isomerase/thioredoxin